MRAAVELKGVAALQCGILDNRRSAKDKVELLPQHPGSEIFVANRFYGACAPLTRFQDKKSLTCIAISIDSFIEGLYMLVEGKPRLKLPRVVLSQTIATIFTNRSEFYRAKT